jgi:ketosteroid isomerase-like protein
MVGGSLEQPISNVETVRAVWAAHAEGRIDDMVALLDLEVMWRPLSRGTQSLYFGWTGTRRMLAEMAQMHGSYMVVLDDVVERSPGQVEVRARMERVEPDGSTMSLPVWMIFALRDGVVITVDTRNGDLL